jgi:potassium efflux system protein
MRLLLATLCVALAFGLGLANPALSAKEAALSPAPRPSDKTAEPKVESIPVEQIGVASQRALRVFNEMAEGLRPSEAVEKVQQELPALRQSAADALHYSQSMRGQEPSVLALEQSGAELRESLSRFDLTQRRLSERATQVAAQIENAGNERKTWSATREKLIVAEVDSKVVAPIIRVEAAINEAHMRATERQGVIVKLQSEVAALYEGLSAELDAVEALRLSLVGQIFQRDQPPLWGSEFWTVLTRSDISMRLSVQRERQTSAIAVFYQQRRESIVRHLILTLLFAALAFYLRPAARNIFSGENDIASVSTIFEGPIVLTALVSFLVALLWVPSEVPALVSYLTAATLVPAVILLRRIVGPPLYPVLNALIAFFFIVQLRNLTVPLAALGRIIFLGEILAANLMILNFLRPSRLSKIPEEALNSPIFRSVGVGLRLALVATFCAFTAEATGYGALAHLLDRGVVAAVYAAALFYGVVQVAEGVVIFALRVKPLNQLRMVRRHRQLLQGRAERALIWIGWLSWFSFSLAAANLLDPALSGAQVILGAVLPLPEVTITLGDLVSSALTLWGATLISRFLRFVLEEDVFARMTLVRGRSNTILTLARYAILLVGFVLACMALGFDINRFTLLTGAFGIGIGFGLQSIVNNFVSGLILLTERPIEIGDAISLGETFGEVQKIGIRSSTVRTWQGAEIIVPNSDLITQQVINWTLSDRKRRIEIPVGVAYGTDPRRVIAILESVALETPKVLETPAPYVLFNGFGDSSLDFEIRAWTDDFDDFLMVRSSICLRVVDALSEANIVVPFPQRDLYLKQISASADMATLAAGGNKAQPDVPELLPTSNKNT